MMLMDEDIAWCGAGDRSLGVEGGYDAAYG